MSEDMRKFTLVRRVEFTVVARDEDDAVATFDAGLDRLTDTDLDDGTRIVFAMFACECC